ncbi:HugZ family protein [Aurantimonas aggregata]|uniref:HugZ family pyridoxamine 5'-phosphate oxidase n=1 Tax=Aurantimonas aggregata TaxID=2047720 RepID=UPI0031B5DEC4
MSLLQPVADTVRALGRRLLREARHGALAVIGPTGHPAASRVLVATDACGNPMILISDLSAHAAALAADLRCSLLVGDVGKGDPLAHPRLSLSATATPINAAAPERPAMRERFLSRHPKAALYADFADFRFVRLEPVDAALNGGFGRAYALEPTDLIDEPVAGLEEAGIRARDHMNADHGDAVDQIARRHGEPHDGWRIVTVDRSGFEIGRGDRLRHVAFALDPAGPGGFRRAFVALLAEASEAKGA